MKNFQKQKEILFVIPARSGSKGVKNKNLKLCAGESLLRRAVKIAIDMDFDSRIIVSTDSENYLNHVEDLKCSKNFLRTSYLSGDTIGDIEVLTQSLHSAEVEYNENYMCVAMLQPTSPIRKLNDINAAIDDVLSGEYNSSISCTRTHNFVWEKDSNSKWIAPYGNKRPRRQDFHQLTETGSFYAFNTLKFLQKGDRIIDPINIIETDEISSYEIDSPIEWEIMEALIQVNK